MPPYRLRAAAAATLLAVGLAGCSSGGDRPAPAPSGTPAGAASAAPGGASAGPGGAASAAPTGRVPAGHAPSRSFPVGVRDLRVNRDDRALPVTIWYPRSGTAAGPEATPRRGARAASGRFPVVLFSHGLGARPADYQRLLAGWAAAGFVVAAPTYPNTSRGAQLDVLDVLNQPADASYALTAVLRLDGRAGDPLSGHLATDRVAAAGHSAGGVTTVGLFTADRDARLDAGIVLAGSALGVGTGYAGPAAPLLFVHGERDNVVSYASGKAAYDAVPWPKALLSLPNGDHGGALLRRGNPAFPPVEDSTVDFLRWSLYGDAAALRRLPRDATRGGLADLDDRL
ncbi:alpha/beta hydrolase family protein [Plantactinospora siamensis]|uniref:Alpha/beta hydrolase family protein n=1 Tax=Plantactinospora siamensis TaxID=555372 RepID=A0ABV6NZF9_9ACTN